MKNQSDHGTFRLKRVYDEASSADGTRVLIDRLWPRGLAKEDAKIDLWLKEIAPTTELRKWFNHDQEKFDEFRGRYLEELGKQTELIQQLRDAATESRVTLLYAARETTFNHAVVLRDFLNQLHD